MEEAWERVPLAEPDLGDQEREYLLECFASGWISSIGPFVNRFEAELGRQVDRPYVLSTANGTVALHLALAALDVGPGDEVIVPNFTFAATANAVLYCGATPVLVDVCFDDWGLDVEAVERALTPRTRGILAVHLYGHPCRLEPLLELCQARGLFLVEDAAESLGALYRGRPVGSFGDVACFSFYGNKIVTTGEGGACVTARLDLFERMGRLRDHGMNKARRYWHEEVGFNYRMTSLQAAVGVAQLERLNAILKRRREITERYLAGLVDTGLGLPRELPGVRNVFWMFNVLASPTGPTRDELAQYLDRHGIDSRNVFFPLHQMPPYRRFVPPGATFPVSEELSRRGLSLPSSSRLSDAAVDRVIVTLRQALRVPAWTPTQ